MKGGIIMSVVYIKNLDEEKKNKAMFILKCQGKDLTKAVRELVDELAKQFDEMQKNNS
jgi:hypothetical protein